MTKWVQTLAFLEIAHVALGLVYVLFAPLDLRLADPALNHSRSGLGTTVMQVSSRVFMVWFICHNYPAVSSLHLRERGTAN